MGTGEIVIFDNDECMYAHNEMEFGTWRCKVCLATVQSSICCSIGVVICLCVASRDTFYPRGWKILDFQNRPTKLMRGGTSGQRISSSQSISSIIGRRSNRPSRWRNGMIGIAYIRSRQPSVTPLVTGEAARDNCKYEEPATWNRSEKTAR